MNMSHKSYTDDLGDLPEAIARKRDEALRRQREKERDLQIKREREAKERERQLEETE
jgi:hypothetical protein